MAKAKGPNAGSAAPTDAGGGGDASSAGTAIDDTGSIAGIGITDPAGSASIGGTDGDAPRKRGRPAGSGTGTKRASQAKAVPATVTGVEKLLFAIHTGLSGMTGVAALKIDHEESKLLAESILEVSSHYDMVVDPKVMAWAGLIGVAGQIYGPRIALWKIEAEMRKADKPKKETAKPEIPGGLQSADAPIAPIFTNLASVG